ncbi:MAG: glycosyl hydrolase [Gordonia sp. (in: high G+C Gram-positive bacteria)]
MTALHRRDVLRLGMFGAATFAATTLAATSCAPTVTPTSPASPVSSAQYRWGAFIPTVISTAATDHSPIARLAALAGAQPGYLHRFAAFGDSAPIGEFDAISATGATPLLTLEPWVPGAGIVQPQFALSRVAAGAFDDDVRRWASNLRAWGKPLLLRFAQEMNGTWYPWAVGTNTNTATDYRAAWIRVRSVFADAGAHNVRFVWSPNVITTGTNDFTDAYPGSSHVDILGLDGYNWGDTSGHQWQSAHDLFIPSLATLRGLDPDHPILITEVASADAADADRKARWIRDFVGLVGTQARVDGFLWFQMDKERDWRFNSTPQSTLAFHESLATLLKTGQPG